MRIAHYLHFIFAEVEFISAGVVFVCIAVIVGREVIAFERHRDFVACTGLDQISLGKADEHDVRLLDPARDIRSGHINFDDVLARHVAGVGDADGNGKLFVLFGRPGELFTLFEGHVRHAPVKGRIGKSVAVREDNIVFVPLFSVGKSAGLIVAVSDIDALFVVDVVLCDGRRTAFRHEIHVASRHEIVGEVFIRRILREVAAIGVHRSAGRIDRAVEHSAERVDAGVSGAADPDAGVDLVGDVFHPVDDRIVMVVRRIQETEFHGGRRVDDDDHLVEIVACLHEHILLVLVQLEVMIVSVICAFDRSAVFVLHRAGKVEGLAADTGEHDERGVVVVFIAVFDRLRVARERRLARAEAGIGIARVIHFGRFVSARTGLAVVLVERVHDGVDIKARSFQALIQRGRIFRHGKRTRTRTAVSEVDRVFAEHGHLCAFGERKSVGFVLHESNTLFVDALVHEVGFFKGIFLILVIGHVELSAAEHFDLTIAERHSEHFKQHRLG